MATPTYDLLDTITTTSVVSSVTFTSLATTYKDLVVEATVKANQYDSWLGLRFNSVSSADYNFVDYYYPTLYVQSNNANQIQFYGRVIDTDWTSFSINIFDYRATDKHTAVNARYGYGAGATGMTAARFASTSSITSINLFGGQGLDFAVGSKFKLYGIAG